MRRMVKPALALSGLLTVATACAGVGSVERQLTTPETQTSPTPGATTAVFPYSSEPIAIEPGTYRISKSEWALRDFTVAFPDGWTVQYGHVYAKHPDAADEIGFYAVVVDAIFADACRGGEVSVEVGPSVDDLAQALIQHSGPVASASVQTTLGGHPATRVDFAVPDGFDVQACRMQGAGLQIWYSPPADKHFVLLPDGRASAYIVDVDGQRQVFLSQHRSATSDEQVAELQAILDSIVIDTSPQ